MDEVNTKLMRSIITHFFSTKKDLLFVFVLHCLDSFTYKYMSICVHIKDFKDLKLS